MLRIRAELMFALEEVEGQQLRAWGVDAVRLWGSGLVRRASNLAELAQRLSKGTLEVSVGLYDAARAGRLTEQVSADSKTAWAKGSARVSSTADTIGRWCVMLRDHPREVAPELLVTVFASLAVAGGPDADGGAPDLDLMFGIGAHRALWSHSIVMGSALEALIFSTVALVDLVHAKLPVEHGPWWDEVRHWSKRVSTAAAQGAAIGMAYHLGVDGTLQPGTYHGVPFPLPMEAHEALFVANAGAELADVPNKAAVADQVASHSQRPNPARSKQPAPRPVAPPTRSMVEAQHLAVLRQPMEIHREIAAHLCVSDLELLRRHGSWLTALFRGTLQPLTDEQRRFVDSARGRRLPSSPHERAWHTYLVLKKQLGV